jgi:hypothetical protein
VSQKEKSESFNMEVVCDRMRKGTGRAQKIKIFKPLKTAPFLNFLRNTQV